MQKVLNEIDYQEHRKRELYESFSSKNPDRCDNIKKAFNLSHGKGKRKKKKG